MNTGQKQFIGDGVAVSIEDDRIKLETMRIMELGGLNRPIMHIIYLDNDVFNNLVGYVSEYSQDKIIRTAQEQQNMQQIYKKVHCDKCNGEFFQDELQDGLCLGCEESNNFQ